MIEMRHITQGDLLGELRSRFGEDPMNWAFCCRNCADEASGQDFNDALKSRPRTHGSGKQVIASDLLGQECIGRTLGSLQGKVGTWRGRGCDWSASGMFSGPWFMELPDGTTRPCFPLADKKSKTGSGHDH